MIPLDLQRQEPIDGSGNSARISQDPSQSAPETVRNRKTDQIKGAEGYVYFLRSRVPDLIKIGYSDEHPIGRYRRLRATNAALLETIAIKRGCLMDESELHRKFLKHWDHGEWFRPDPELLSHIALIAEPWVDEPPAFRPPKYFLTREEQSKRKALARKKADGLAKRRKKKEASIGRVRNLYYDGLLSQQQLRQRHLSDKEMLILKKHKAEWDREITEFRGKPPKGAEKLARSIAIEVERRRAARAADLSRASIPCPSHPQTPPA